MRCFPLFLLPVLTATVLRAQITAGPAGFPEITLETTTPPGELMTPRISTDLVTWEQLAPVTVAADGTVRFTDFGGASQRRRFYQATPLPGPGTWIVYERRTADGNSTIYRSHPDGTTETALVVGRYPRPSPDGRWILLERNGTGPSGHSAADIYAYDTTAIPGFNNPRLIYDNGSSYDIVNYCFKHDNFRLVFDYGSGSDGRLYTTTLNGGNPSAFFPTGDCQEAMPSFSPDDSTLAFAHRIPSQITTRRAGEVKHPLTSPGLGDSWPQWSPDGAWIAACDGNTDYTRSDLGHDLLKIDPVAGSRIQLTQLTEAGDGFPCGGAWSANSLWIYAAGTVNGIQGMWRVPVTGGDPQPVYITSVFDIAPGLSTAPVVFVGGVVP